MVFYSISSNIDQVLSINPSANVFVFGDFNVHHKDWLIYSGGTDRPGELSYNFSISNDLTQMVNFPTRILDWLSLSCSFRFISSDATNCSTMAFPPLGNSNHVVSQFPLTFHQIHNRIPCFIAYRMAILMLIRMVFVIIWEMFHGRISLNSVLLLLLQNFVSGFRLESMYISHVENLRSSLIHLFGFQLLLLLP